MFLLTPRRVFPGGGAFRREEERAHMPKWARIFMLLTGMLAWTAIVAVSLLLREIPDAWIIGFPAALWLALTGKSRIARRGTARSESTAVDMTVEREADST